MTREVVLRTNLREESHLLIDILRRAALDQAGDTEADAVRGRLIVLKFPFLEVLVAFVARPGLGRVDLQGESLLDPPGDGAVVAEIRGQLTPGQDNSRELLRHVLVRDWDEVRVPHDLDHQVHHELLQLARVVHEDQLLVVREAEDDLGESVERCLAIHV